MLICLDSSSEGKSQLLRCAKPLSYRIEKKTVQPLVVMPTLGRLKKKLSQRDPKQVENQSNFKNVKLSRITVLHRHRGGRI